MKDSKFWIWFIPLFLIFCVGIYIMLVRNTQNVSQQSMTDAIEIKNQYLNDNNEYFNIELSDNNVYKYATEDIIKELLNNKDALIFIGDVKSNISRKNILVLNDVVSSTSIPQVYYYDKNKIIDEFNSYLIQKLDVDVISSGTLIAIQNGKVLNVYYPSYVSDNKVLSDNEKQTLMDEYQKIIDDFIEACDENC